MVTPITLSSDHSIELCTPLSLIEKASVTRNTPTHGAQNISVLWMENSFELLVGLSLCDVLLHAWNRAGPLSPHCSIPMAATTPLIHPLSRALAYYHR